VKQCYKCKETKPFSEFSKFKKNKDGLFSYCKKCHCESNAKHQTTPKGRARKLISDANYRKNGKRAYLEKTLIFEDILPVLEIGKCQLTGLPFDFSPSKISFRNLYAPSLDRIDSNKGYSKDNVRIVLSSVNTALGEHTDEEMLPILEAMVKGIKKNAQENTAAPVSAGDHIQGAVGAELGSVSTPWTWEDDDQPHHHCGTIPRQDTDHRTQAGSGDGMGHGGTEVGAPKTLEGFKDYWQSREKTRRIVG
jgi:hypothetical protein